MSSARRFVRPFRFLSISLGLAFAGLIGSMADAQAQFRGGFRGPSLGTRPMLSHGPRFHGKFHGIHRNSGLTVRKPGLVIGRGGKAGGGKIADTRPPSRNGHTHRPPHRRPPHGKHPPGTGPIGPVAPIVGAGVVVGTLGAIGPVNAGPRPPQSGFSEPQPLPARIHIPPANEWRFVADEVVLEFAGNRLPQDIAAMLARHGLTQLEAQRFVSTGSHVVRVRIARGQSVRSTLSSLGRETVLRAGQANFLYSTAEATAPIPAAAAASALPAAGDPAQYALKKLRLGEAHSLATGDKIVVAVIDSGIDLSHPELQGVVAGTYDALGKTEKPHAHGTGVAGTIVAKVRLLGVAPSARILAIRAFGSTGNNAESTTFAIMKGLEYAIANNARVINMSFAGPADPGVARQLSIGRSKGVVLVAASGNLGPKAALQYPAADPNVIAVSAIDANDRMFKAASVGSHIAVTAPGVDILAPAPDRNYQVISGTSFAAAHVSGVVALMLQRAPWLKPDAVRQALESTAKDIGARGKDRDTGSGLVDAYQAIVAVQSSAAAAPQVVPARLVR